MAFQADDNHFNMVVTNDSPYLPAQGCEPTNRERRNFLIGSVAVLGSGISLPIHALANPVDRLTIAPGAVPPRVVCTSHPKVNSGTTVNEKALRSMIEATIVTLTDKQDPATAWNELLNVDDTVGIKFNRSGAEALGTSNAFGEALLDCLTRVGLSSDRIVLIEAPQGLAERFGCRTADHSYDREPTSFASGADQLSSALRQVTALINVPFLKSHNIAGMTCALKNLSHGLTKHPARYHSGGCSPFIGDIVSLPAIRSKLRLTLVNGLRVVFQGGPEGSRDSIADGNFILAAIDPVACDALGLQVLNQIRQSRGIDAIARSPGQLPYLAHAHRIGLGVALSSAIELRRLEL